MMEVTLDDLELARGRRDIVKRLGELRQASPSMRVVKDFSPAPARLVEMMFQGRLIEVLVDPLDIFRRAGVEIVPPDWITEPNEWQEE